jgi:glycoside/pentoside/hexuronide:cation symporter, GPH family
VGVLNPYGYRRYGLAAATMILLAILVSAIGTHRFIPYLKRPPRRRPLGVRGIFRELGETLSNRSFLALFCAGLFGAMAAGLQAALAIYVNTYFWELTSSQISMLVMSSFASAVLAFVASPMLSRRLGKKQAAIGVSLTGVAVGPAPILLRLLDLFPANGSPNLMPVLFVFNLVTVTLVIMAGILTSSMTADIVEDSELSTGRRSEGVFVAANAFVGKAVSGVGIFASTLLLAVIGFPSDAKPGAVDPLVVRRLGLAFAPALVVLYLIAIGFLASYAISRERHVANLEKLAEKARS